MPPVIESVLIFCAGAMATAVISKLVALAFERSANLVVSVSLNESFKSDILAEEVRNWRKSSMPSADWIKMSFSEIQLCDLNFSSEGYARLLLRNNGSKKITNLSLINKCLSFAVVQVDNGRLARLSTNATFQIGDLKPRTEIVVHILCSAVRYLTAGDFKKGLHFTADELGRVKYKFPLSRLVLDRILGWSFYIVMLIGILMSLAPLLVKKVWP